MVRRLREGHFGNTRHTRSTGCNVPPPKLPRTVDSRPRFGQNRRSTMVLQAWRCDPESASGGACADVRDHLPGVGAGAPGPKGDVVRRCAGFPAPPDPAPLRVPSQMTEGPAQLLDGRPEPPLPSTPGHECQRPAPACWPATLLRGGVLRVTTRSAAPAVGKRGPATPGPSDPRRRRPCRSPPHHQPRRPCALRATTAGAIASGDSTSHDSAPLAQARHHLWPVPDAGGAPLGEVRPLPAVLSAVTAWCPP